MREMRAIPESREKVDKKMNGLFSVEAYVRALNYSGPEKRKPEDERRKESAEKKDTQEEKRAVQGRDERGSS